MLDNLLTRYRLGGNLDVGFLSYINNKVSTSHVGVPASHEQENASGDPPPFH